MAVDIYPTLAALAGATTSKCKPLAGVNVWDTIAENKPSPRTKIVYNAEPFRGAVRQGDFKLIWRTMLPSSVDVTPSSGTSVPVPVPGRSFPDRCGRRRGGLRRRQR
jgi:hypothetical protein